MKPFKPTPGLAARAICSAVTVQAIQLAPVWVLSRLFDVSFWRALAAWIAVALALGAFAAFYRFVAWRMGGKALATARILHMMREAQFPQRFSKGDTYLYRITEPDYSFSEETRVLAQLLELESDGFRGFTTPRSFAHARRITSVCEAALEAYSPRANAPDDVDEGCRREMSAAQPRRAEAQRSRLIDDALALGVL